MNYGCLVPQFNQVMAAMVDLVERRVRDRKAADYRFDSRSGNASLCSWEDNLRHFPTGTKLVE